MKIMHLEFFTCLDEYEFVNPHKKNLFCCYLSNYAKYFFKNDSKEVIQIFDDNEIIR